MMRFADPLVLILLFFVIPIFYFAKFSGGRFRFSSIESLKALKNRQNSFWHPRNLLLALRILAFASLVLGMARPQMGKKFSEVESEGVDIILAIDTSGSMKAMDFQLEGRPIDRLEVVKKVAADFVNKRPADRIGVVVFGEEAFTQCPLTLDHGIVLDFLKQIEIGMAGDGTAIGQGLGTSIKRIKDVKSKSKVVILLTDGRNNAGRISPVKAAELAKVYGIKVYTIGAGTHGKAPFLMDTFFGKRYVYQEVDIDEDTLKTIAHETNAKYFRATDTKELEKIYDEIDRLEKTEVKTKEYTEYNELFHWFVIPGLLLLLLEIILGNTLLRKIP